MRKTSRPKGRANMRCSHCSNPARIIVEESLGSALNDTRTGVMCWECYEQNKKEIAVSDSKAMQWAK